MNNKQFLTELENIENKDFKMFSLKKFDDYSIQIHFANNKPHMLRIFYLESLFDSYFIIEVTQKEIKCEKDIFNTAVKYNFKINNILDIKN
jgi:hypothetical protein